jgi:hypothetical protein
VTIFRRRVLPICCIAAKNTSKALNYLQNDYSAPIGSKPPERVVIVGSGKVGSSVRLPLIQAGAGNSEWGADDFPENPGYH